MNPSTKLVLSALLSSLSAFKSSPIEHTIDKVATALRREIMHIGFRLLSGVILACLIVLAFVHMADAVDTLNSQFDNGPVFSLLVFGSLTLLCGGGFYFTLRPGPIKQAPPESPSGIHLEALALKFAEGLMDGLNQSIPTEKPNVENAMGSNNTTPPINTH